MTEHRWSYDQRDGRLQVWTAENGHPSHYDVCGGDGYLYCAQGRMYGPEDGQLRLTMYGNRPLIEPDETKHPEVHMTPNEVRQDALLRVRSWVSENLHDVSVVKEEMVW